MALTVNGTDVSASIRDGILEVIDTSNFGDGLILSFHFSPPLNLGRPDREVQFFHGIFRGPQTLFSGTGVPQDLTFLASVTSTDSVFVGGTGIPCDIDPSNCLEIVAIGTLTARLPDTEVPEPGSIFLLGSGIVGALLRKRRRPTPSA
jgi:PEP-CTERM motif